MKIGKKTTPKACDLFCSENKEIPHWYCKDQDHETILKEVAWSWEKCSWITVTSLKIHGIFVTTFLLYFSSPFISQSFLSASVCPIIFLQLWQKRNNYFTALGFLNHHVKMCCDSSHMRFFSKFSKNESVFCSTLWNTEIIFWFDFQKFFIFPHYCTVVEQLTWTKLRFQDY